MATEIRVPTLGESVTEATIGKWFKKPGDAVAVDEPLVSDSLRDGADHDLCRLRGIHRVGIRCPLVGLREGLDERLAGALELNIP